MSSHTLRTTLLLAALAGSVQAQATVFEGPTGGPGNVVLRPAPSTAGTRPAELQGIFLLPIDATGRSRLTQFQADQPRLKTDLSGASRLVLPGGHGCLYRYRRPLVSGSEFGFFIVRPDGLAAFIAAVPGTGPLGNTDPIPNPVAISSTGDGMLFATTVDAGGDVYEVELPSGIVHPLTASTPPLDVMPQGLALQPLWGAVLSTDGARRFVRGDSNLNRIPLEPRSASGSLGSNPGAPQPVLAHMGNGLARSSDGSTMALIAGSSATQAHVFAFEMAGPSMCVNENGASIADPGFGTQAGPTLALSPNGRRAAWKTTLGSGECFTRQVTLQQGAIEYQVTSDQNFTDTLNDTGVIAFFDPDSVVMLVGEFNGAGGVEKADFYRATFPVGGGAPALTNLTNTSGDTVAPFLEKGDLETSDGIYQIPGKQGSVYFVPGSSGQGTVYRLDGTNGNVQIVRSGIAQLDLVETAGTNLVLQVLHDSPSQHELVRVPFDHAQPVASMGFYSASQTISASAGNAAGIFAGRLNVLGGHRMFQVSVNTGTGSLLPGTALYGSTLGFALNGSLLATIQNPSIAYAFAWGLGGGNALYGSGPVGTIVLPAN